MKTKVVFIVSLLFGLLFINSGLNKFLQYMPMPEQMPEDMVKLMQAFVQIGWIFPLVAIVEIVGGVLFITNKYRALGAIVIFPIVIGILLIHVITEPSGLPMAIIVLAIDVWIIIENRKKYLPMIQ